MQNKLFYFAGFKGNEFVIHTFVLMNYSDKIRELRKGKGISQTDMADLIGISQAAYGKIESGFTKSISIDIGKGIAKALNVSFGELFDVEDTNSEDLKKQHEVWEKEMQVLWDSIKKKNKEIEDKELIIELLKREREIYKQSVIISIETYYSHRLSELKKELKEEKDEKKRIYLQNVINALPEDKQHDLDNFLYMGFLSKKDIDSLYAELREHFSKYNQNK